MNSAQTESWGWNGRRGKFLRRTVQILLAAGYLLAGGILLWREPTVPVFFSWGRVFLFIMGLILMLETWETPEERAARDAREQAKALTDVSTTLSVEEFCRRLELSFERLKCLQAGEALLWQLSKSCLPRSAQVVIKRTRTPDLFEFEAARWKNEACLMNARGRISLENGGVIEFRARELFDTKRATEDEPSEGEAGRAAFDRVAGLVKEIVRSPQMYDKGRAVGLVIKL